MTFPQYMDVYKRKRVDAVVPRYILSYNIQFNMQIIVHWKFPAISACLYDTKKIIIPLKKIKFRFWIQRICVSAKLQCTSCFDRLAQPINVPWASDSKSLSANCPQRTDRHLAQATNPIPLSNPMKNVQSLTQSVRIWNPKLQVNWRRDGLIWKMRVFF